MTSESIGKLLPFRRPTDHESAPDEALVAAVAEGDGSALEALFWRFGDRVYRILGRIHGPDPRHLGELLQATFLEVRRAAADYDRGACVGSWIVGIALELERAHVGSLAARHTSSARMSAGLRALPRKLHTVFSLCDLEGMRGIEVARALGLSERTVWRRLHRARRLLRISLAGGRPPSWLARVGAVVAGCWCPRWRLTRAVSQGLDPHIVWHLSRCVRCAAEYRALDDLVTGVAALPAPEMDREIRRTLPAQLVTAYSN
jgi:DNA-directed RNA polymerase specialized sigma24 family protein